MSSSMLQAKIDELDTKIVNVESEIKEVDADIKKVAVKIEQCKNVAEKEHLWTEKEALREEKKDLRREKEALRDEKALRMRQEEDVRTKQGGLRQFPVLPQHSPVFFTPLFDGTNGTTVALCIGCCQGRAVPPVVQQSLQVITNGTQTTRHPVPHRFALPQSFLPCRSEITLRR
jgi:hypothetical protein